MLDRSKANEEKSNSVLDAPTPAHVAMRMAYDLYQEFIGVKYSEAERTRLKDLKDIYQEMLGQQPPVEWDLDDQHRPTKRICHTKRAMATHQAFIRRHKTGQYNERCIAIAEDASNYLTERGARLVGNGRSGDVLEQFFGEWISFATNELPTYEYDQASIDKLQLRIAYVEAVQRNESLFSFGTISRGKNKFGVMEDIKRELQKSIIYANKESDRACARDKLDTCRKEMGAMLAAYARSLFFSRDHSVNTESLKIAQYVKANKLESSGNNKLDALYIKIKNTFSGAMLNDFINISGLDAFNEQSSKEIELDLNKKMDSIFFNEDFSPTPLDLKKEKAKFDFAPWITVEMEVAHVRNHQAIMSAALHLAKLKSLVEDAYDLAGSSGDEWAYGDLEGKLPLNALLVFVRQKLLEFKELFLVMYNDEKAERNKYNQKCHVGPAAQINKNYNKVDEQLNIVKKNVDHIMSSINDILSRMEQFTKEDVEKIKEKKKSFRENVFSYVDNYNKRFSSEYKILSQNAVKNDDQRRLAEKIDVNLVQNKEGMHDFFYSFDSNSELRSKTIGNREFKRWKMNFVEKNKRDHMALKKTRDEFKNALEQLSLTVSTERSECVNRIKTLGLTMNEQAKKLIYSAEYLMPVWHLGSYVISNPFKRGLKSNLMLLINDLSLLLSEVDTQVELCESQKVISSPHSSSTSMLHQVFPVLDSIEEQKSNSTIDLGREEANSVDIARSIPMLIPKEASKLAKNDRQVLSRSFPATTKVSSTLPKLDDDTVRRYNKIINQSSL